MIQADNYPGRSASLQIDLVSYSYDASDHVYRPKAAVWPTDKAQVSRVLAFANEKKIPVVPRGAGKIEPNFRVEDVTVPISKVPVILKGIQEIAKIHEVRMATWGHVGDGNIHPCFTYDGSDPTEAENVEKAAAELFKLTVELGGTLSGEHGIGISNSEITKKISQTSCSSGAEPIARIKTKEGLTLLLQGTRKKPCVPKQPVG